VSQAEPNVFRDWPGEYDQSAPVHKKRERLSQRTLQSAASKNSDGRHRNATANNRITLKTVKDAKA